MNYCLLRRKVAQVRSRTANFQEVNFQQLGKIFHFPISCKKSDVTQLQSIFKNDTLQSCQN
jgi:hypothetical protein